MLKIRKPKMRNSYKVRVVDEDGNEEIFDSAKVVASIMKVTVQAVYTAISRKITICGCRVYKVASSPYIDHFDKEEEKCDKDA